MPQAEIISSTANPLVKQVRRAVSRGERTAEGFAVAETFHLLEEALRSECEVQAILVAESAQGSVEGFTHKVFNARVVVLPDKLLEALSDTETSQGVIALVRLPEWQVAQLFPERCLVVALDGLQDPGNAGAIARSAEAFGASGVLFLKGAVSPFNPKALRASAGSLFRIPFLQGVDPAVAVAEFRQHGVNVYAAVSHRGAQGAKLLHETDLARACALVIGSEAHGVSASMRTHAHEVSIPTIGVESLNAAAAAAVLLYEAQRQRSLQRA